MYIKYNLKENMKDDGNDSVASQKWPRFLGSRFFYSSQQQVGD